MPLTKDELDDFLQVVERAHIDLGQAALYARDSKYEKANKNLDDVVTSLKKFCNLVFETKIDSHS